MGASPLASCSVVPGIGARRFGSKNFGSTPKVTRTAESARWISAAPQRWPFSTRADALMPSALMVTVIGGITFVSVARASSAGRASCARGAKRRNAVRMSVPTCSPGRTMPIVPSFVARSSISFTETWPSAEAARTSGRSGMRRPASFSAEPTRACGAKTRSISSASARTFGSG